MPKKVWVPKKYEFQKTRIHIFLGPNIVPKKICGSNQFKQKNKHLEKQILPVFFLGTDFQFKQQKIPAKKYLKVFLEPILFFGTHTFCSAQCSARKNIFFSGTHIFFWHLHFFLHNVRPEKSMSPFFLELLFSKPYFFSAQWLDPKKIWIPFFGTHTFISTMLGPNKNDVSLGTQPFFLEPIFFFWRNVWIEKVYEFRFFLEPILFLSLCWARKSMNLSVHFFVIHIFFFAFSFLAQFLARKNISSLFWK